MKQQKHEGDLASALSERPTEQKHTPGPWKVYYGSTHCQVCAVGPDARGADALTPKFSLDIGNGAANARLIAAAPDLLAALRELIECDDTASDWTTLDLLDAAQNGPAPEIRRQAEAVLAARAAIVRATGKQDSAGHSDSTEAK